MTTIEKISLYNQQGNSDKVYLVNLIQESDGYSVIAFNGRRGGSLKERKKTPAPIQYFPAKKIYDDLVNEKLRDGYTEGAEIGGVVVSSSNNNADSQNLSGLLPQLLNSIDANDVFALINDDRYMAQEKFDGERRMVRKTVDEVIGSNKRGLITNLAKTIDTSIRALNTDGLELDGEEIGDHYYVFDLLKYDSTTITSTSALNRYKQLKTLVPDSEFIHVVYTAFTSAEKLALYNKIMGEGGEGIVFKLKSSAYQHGRPNSGGDQLKYKFVETCSCVVTAFHSTKRSVAISLYKDDTLTDVGNVTIPPNKDMPLQDAIVEIRYLYAFPEGSLIQPVYLGERNDIVASECDVSQLKYKQALKAA